MTRQIIVDIVGDASKFKKATNDATNDATHLTVGFKTLSVASLAVGAGTAIAGAAMNVMGNAVSSVTGFLEDAVGQAIAEEAALSRLDAALRANVEGYDGNREAIDKVIQSRMALGFSDDEQIKSMATAVAATHDVTKAIQLEAVAMDLARFKGISLEDATSALVKVEAGQYRMLKTLGITLKDGATATEALAAVEKVAGGQAEAFAETTAGAMAEAAVKIDDLKGKLGDQLLPVLGNVADAASHTADNIAVLGDKTATAGEKVQTLADMLGGLGDAYNSVNPLSISASMAGETFNDTLNAQRIAAEAASKELGTRLLSSVSMVGSAEQDTAAASGTLTDKLVPLHSKIGDLAGAFRTTRDKVNDLSDAFLEAAFAPEQLKLELQSTNLELRFQKRHLENLEAQYDKHPTKKLEKDIIDLKLEISESTEKSQGLKAKINALDGTTTKEVQKEIADVGKRAKNARPEVQDLTKSVETLERLAEAAWARLYALKHPGQPIPDGGGARRFHSGGIVPGRTGAEVLAVLQAGERVIPLNSSGSSGGSAGPTVVNLYITEGAYIDGPSIDRLTNLIAQRLNYSPAT